MNVLVTGGAGFIGSHVARRLSVCYPLYNVVVMDKMDYCADMKNLEEIANNRNFKFVKGDVADSDFVNYIIDKEKINVVMHFAAQTHVDNSFGNSLKFTQNNVYGTHVLLESAKNNKNVKRFIHVSTDEVYGETKGDVPFGEGTILNPTNPYSATKAAAEMLVMAYAHSYGLPVIVTRGNNVYGPGQYPEKVIPKFCVATMEGKKMTVHGKGGALRSYLHIDDVVEAFDLILHKGVTGEIYNIATHYEYSVTDIAEMICKHFGKKVEECVEFVEDRPFNDRRYFIEDKKLKELGWKPKVEFEEGLKSTLEWYEKKYKQLIYEEPGE